MLEVVYFGWSDEAIGFVRCMINSILSNRLADELPKIIIFYKEKRGSKNAGSGSPAADHVKDRVMKDLNGELGGLQFEVFELREAAGSDVFHNRCILTEHGGVLTGHGIGVSNNEAHTDEAILMIAEIYQKKLLQFIEEKCFDIVSMA